MTYWLPRTLCFETSFDKIVFLRQSHWSCQALARHASCWSHAGSWGSCMASATQVGDDSLARERPVEIGAHGVCWERGYGCSRQTQGGNWGGWSIVSQVCMSLLAGPSIVEGLSRHIDDGVGGTLRLWRARRMFFNAGSQKF